MTVYSHGVLINWKLMPRVNGYNFHRALQRKVLDVLRTDTELYPRKDYIYVIDRNRADYNLSPDEDIVLQRVCPKCMVTSNSVILFESAEQAYAAKEGLNEVKEWIKNYPNMKSCTVYDVLKLSEVRRVDELIWAPYIEKLKQEESFDV